MAGSHDARLHDVEEKAAGSSHDDRPDNVAAEEAAKGAADSIHDDDRPDNVTVAAGRVCADVPTLYGRGVRFRSRGRECIYL